MRDRHNQGTLTETFVGLSNSCLYPRGEIDASKHWAIRLREICWDYWGIPNHEDHMQMIAYMF